MRRQHLLSRPPLFLATLTLPLLSSCIVQTEQLGCDEGAVELCPWTHDTGKPGTGICVAATRTCAQDGRFGPCTGEVGPKAAEDCSTLEDDDCDGQVNESDAGCQCIPGTAISCFEGPAPSQNVGACHPGLATCESDGKGYAPCVGQILPADSEDCSTILDDNCDGLTNEGCVCFPNAAESCYDGPLGTEGVGNCGSGSRTCNVQGADWGPCVGGTTPKIEMCQTFEDEDCDGSGYCVGAHRWSRQLGADGFDSGTGMAVDHQGNVFLTGIFSNDMVVGNTDLQSAGGWDIFLAKLDPFGAVIWAKSFGGPSQEGGESVALDSDGDIIVSASLFGNGTVDLGGQCQPVFAQGNGDILLAKLDSNGSCLWAKAFGDADTQLAIDIAVDTDNSIVLVGRFSGSIAFGNGPILTSSGNTDAFVAKFNAAGQSLWAKRYGDSAEQGLRSASLTAQGDIFVAGYFSGAIDFGDGLLQSAGGYDAVVARLKPSGDCIWSKRFGDQADQQAYTLVEDGDGNLFLSGDMEGSPQFGNLTLISAGDSDVFLAKLSSTADTVFWARNYGDAAAQGSMRVRVDAAGNVSLAGDFKSTITFDGNVLTSAGQYNTFVAKLDSAGNHLWSHPLHSTGNLSSIDLRIDDLGRAFLVGQFSGSSNLGDGAMHTAGGTDVFLVTTSP